MIQGLWFKVRGVSEDPPITHPRAYLHRLAANLAVDHLRKERTTAALFEAVEDDVQTPCDRPSPERVVLGRDALARVAAALDELPPRCREVVRMRRVDGMDVGEIARVMGISRQMVWRYMNQAMDHISARLGEDD